MVDDSSERNYRGSVSVSPNVVGEMTAKVVSSENIAYKIIAKGHSLYTDNEQLRKLPGISGEGSEVIFPPAAEPCSSPREVESSSDD